MTTGNKGDFLAEIIVQTSPICICLLLFYGCFEILSQHVALLGLNFLTASVSLILGSQACRSMPASRCIVNVGL